MSSARTHSLVTELLGPRGERYDLTATRNPLITIGADPEQCTIFVDYPDVSAHQCSLELVEGSWLCRHNVYAEYPTRINRVAVITARLALCDRIRLANTEFLALANTERLIDASALQAFEDAGRNLRVTASSTQMDRATLRRRVNRAASWFGVANTKGQQ